MMGIGTYRIWLPGVMLVTLAHAGIWIGIQQLQPSDYRHNTPGVIEVALLNPAPQSQPVPAPTAVAEPPQPVPNPVVTQRPKPRHIAHAPVRTAPAAAETPTLTGSPPAVVAPEPDHAALVRPDFNAAYLHNPPPAYPLAARRRGVEGRVTVRAEVSARGYCQRVALQTSSGDERLDRAALAAVSQWRFVPARRGDQQVDAWVDVPISFKLKY